MICKFIKLIFPKNPVVDNASYMIALYRPCEKIVDGAGHSISEIKAVGYCLPTTENLRYDLHGRWNRNAKHGVQFEVEGFDEVIAHSKEGIVAYLSSGQIKGVGPKTAEKIFELFGLSTLEILDREPEKLLAVSGISKTKLKKIYDSYLASRGARDVIAFLAPHGVTPNRAVKLYKQYGNQTMDIVRNHPYRLCELVGIGFKTADRIAISMGIDPRSAERVDEGLIFTLTDAEQKGHLCMEKHSFITETLKLLDTDGLTEKMLAIRASRLLESGRLVAYEGQVYREATARTEQNLAWSIWSMLTASPPKSVPDIAAEIQAEEVRQGLQLADEQRRAVMAALTSKLCVITGGPGTGKTMIQRFLLNIYRRRNCSGQIMCCAPTGRAARRMEQSTGFPAMTLHKALGLLAGEDAAYSEPQMLDADLVVVDEVSMMDIYLANHLFQAVPRGSQLVLVGDADQLPSVGPGAVLSEIIACGAVPVVRLDRIFRQSHGSRIAANAKYIRHGNLSLEYGDDFQFFDSSDMEDSAQLIERLYMQEISKYGLDNVALLSPYRQKTETGVNALNDRLQSIVNPQDGKKPEILYRNRIYRMGDKVMQTKNCEDVSNGDIGYITSITTDDSDSMLTVDFGDGRVAEYEKSDLELLDLAYASTIHKSQGSEYKSVIINLQCAHAVMLVRPLVYTAITRAKERVIIVGERRALCIAIRRTDTEQRGTKLAARIRSLATACDTRMLAN